MHRAVSFRAFVTGLALVVLSSALPVRAADSGVLSAVYGEGMKSFYAGQYAQAVDTFSQAIEAGSNDPRCLYFRGLSQLRLGRTAEAQADFTAGAAIEGKDFDVFYNVSESLKRVQGPERLMLERYRAAGRQHALAEIEKIRFEYMKRFEPQNAVVGAATVSGDAPAAAGGATPAATPAVGVGAPVDPFNAPATTTPSADPFNNPAPATPPATTPSTDPFNQM